MATRVRVQCINKREHYNPHERILFIGGVNPDGGRWKLSQPEAIKAIQDGTYSFFVHTGVYTVDVEVAYHEGHPYLKTKPDSTGKDNLLALPECP